MLFTPFLVWCSLAQSQQTQDRNLMEVKHRHSGSQGERQRWMMPANSFTWDRITRWLNPLNSTHRDASALPKWGDSPAGGTVRGPLPSWEPFSLQIKSYVGPLAARLREQAPVQDERTNPGSARHSSCL